MRCEGWRVTLQPLSLGSGWWEKGLQPTEFCSLIELRARRSFAVFALRLPQAERPFRACHVMLGAGSPGVHHWCRVNHGSLSLPHSSTPLGLLQRAGPALPYIAYPSSCLLHSTCFLPSVHDTLVHLIGTDIAKQRPTFSNWYIKDPQSHKLDAAHHVLCNTPKALPQELWKPPKHTISLPDRSHH